MSLYRVFFSFSSTQNAEFNENQTTALIKSVYQWHISFPPSPRAVYDPIASHSFPLNSSLANPFTRLLAHFQNYGYFCCYFLAPYLVVKLCSIHESRQLYSLHISWYLWRVFEGKLYLSSTGLEPPFIRFALARLTPARHFVHGLSNSLPLNLNFFSIFDVK